MRCGIPIVATAHAAEPDEVKRKPGIASLIASGAFDVFVGISANENGYKLTVDRE